MKELKHFRAPESEGVQRRTLMSVLEVALEIGDNLDHICTPLMDRDWERPTLP